jgi:uncharacterized protein
MPSNVKACPLCGKAATEDFRPFCSRGCRDRDLNAWFDEDYRVPVRPAADEGDAPGDPSGDRDI